MKKKEVEEILRLTSSLKRSRHGRIAKDDIYTRLVGIIYVQKGPEVAALVRMMLPGNPIRKMERRRINDLIAEVLKPAGEEVVRLAEHVFDTNHRDLTKTDLKRRAKIIEASLPEKTKPKRKTRD